jgi:hypothetical protein
MILVSQENIKYEASNVTQNGKQITIKNPKDKRRNLVIAVYESITRACDVMLLIRTANNIGAKEFEMPKE